MSTRMTRRRFLYLSAGLLVYITGCTPNPSRPQPPANPSPTPPTPATPTLPGKEAALRITPAPLLDPPEMKFTPPSELYIQSYKGTPTVDIASWELVIDGLVETPLRFTYEELRSLPAREVMWTLECISNPPGGNLIGNQVWKGTPLLPLLEKARVRPEAVRVRWYALDGYSNSLPLERVLHPDTLLVYEMAGSPLTPEHGYPLRVFIPGHYGQKMPKWLHRIELIDRVYLGYWEQKGWDDMARIKPNSRIDAPDKRVKGTVGTPMLIEGVAMADENGVAQVAVGVEHNGDVVWVDTVRTYGPNPYTWVVWRAQWTPEQPGKYRLMARAWDGAGNTQRRGRSSFLEGTFPSGSDYMHTILITVDEV